MIGLVLVSLARFAEALMPLTLAQEPVVVEVIDNGIDGLGVDSFVWSQIQPIGSPIGSDFPSVLVTGTQINNGAVVRHRNAIGVGGKISFVRHRTKNSFGAINTSSAGSSLLRAGSEYCLLGIYQNQFATSEIAVANLDPGGRVRSIPIPQFGTFPPPRSLIEVTSAGDLDQDGWDDIFYQTIVQDASGVWLVIGAIEGRAGNVLWQAVLPDFSSTPDHINRKLTSEKLDLDRDGLKDYVVGYQRSDMSFCYSARSGHDGSEIWSSTDQPGYWLYGRGFDQTQDINHDGVLDLVTTYRPLQFGAPPDEGFTSLIDGATGAQLWRVDHHSVIASLHAKFDPSYGIAWNQHQTVVTPSSEPGVDWEHWVLADIGSSSGIPFLRTIVRMDAATGDFLGFRFLPMDLKPFRDDPTTHPISWNLQNTTAIGDFNLDGHADFAEAIPVDPNLGAAGDKVIAIFSTPSLVTTAQSGVSRQLTHRVWIPRWPSSTCALIASSGFSTNSTHSLDGWRTGLTPSPILARTARSPFTSRLDATGRDQVVTPLPLGVPPGISLYTRGFVVEGSRLRTMTNVTVTIAP
jgi:hypothetical protein